MNEVGRSYDHDHKKENRLVDVDKGAFSSIHCMNEIVDSPYEGTFSAEVGEPIFDQVKSYLDPIQHDHIPGRLEPSREAEHVWGRALARTVVDTFTQIASSGILYGFGWKEGRIHNRDVGKLPGHLLLLCLQEHRICRSNIATSSQVIKDLDLLDELGRIISDDRSWNWRDKYPKLRQVCFAGGGEGMGRKKSNVKSDLSVFFLKKRLQCQKCILFVLRASTCISILQKTRINLSLRTKLEACLFILETNCTPKTIANTSGYKRNCPVNELPKRSSGIGGQSLSGPIFTYEPSSRPRSTVTAPMQRHPHSGKVLGCTEDSSSSDSGEEEYKTGFVDPLNNSLGVLSHRLMGPSSTYYRAANDDEKKDATISHTSTIGRILPSTTQRGNALASAEVSSDEFRTEKSSLFPSVDSNNGRRVSYDSSAQTKSTGSDDNVTDDSVENGAFDSSLDCGSRHRSKNNDSSVCSQSQNHWYPVDPQELILNSVEIEVAWLAEESLFCYRTREIQWDFFWKYASPTLRIELRKLPPMDAVGVCDDRKAMGKLVRLHESLVERRFKIVRQDIRRKLLRNVVRQRMKQDLLRLRRATHPLTILKSKAGRSAL